MAIVWDKDDRLLTLKQAEAMTGRSVATWRRDIFERRVAFVKIGRQVSIPLAVIRGMIESGYVEKEETPRKRGSSERGPFGRPKRIESA